MAAWEALQNLRGGEGGEGRGGGGGEGGRGEESNIPMNIVVTLIPLREKQGDRLIILYVITKPVSKLD